MDGTVDLDLLSLFAAVADSHGFSGAAAKLGLPKSSVSRGISRLEESLNTQLFNRTTRSVGLTTAGLALYERVAPLLRNLGEAVGSLPEQQETPSGLLRITAPADLGAVVLPDLLAQFLRRYPAITVDVWLTNRNVDLVSEGMDVALRASSGPLRDSSLVARKLTEINFQVFASPTYLARRGTPRTEQEATDHDWVAFRGQNAPKGTPVGKARIVGDDYFFIREAIRSGIGIGMLTPFLAREDVAAGLLVRVLPGLCEPLATLYLVYPATKHVPAKTAAFRDFLVEQIEFGLLK